MNKFDELPKKIQEVILALQTKFGHDAFFDLRDEKKEEGINLYEYLIKEFDSLEDRIAYIQKEVAKTKNIIVLGDGYRENYYNIDLEIPGRKVVFNTLLKQSAVIPPIISPDDKLIKEFKLLVPIDTEEEKDFCTNEEKYFFTNRVNKWFLEHKPCSWVVGVDLYDIEERILKRMIQFIIENINENENLEELIIVSIADCYDVKALKLIFSDVIKLCKEKKISIKIKHKHPYLHFEKGCNLKEIRPTKDIYGESCPFAYNQNIIISNEGGLFRCPILMGNPNYQFGSIFERPIIQNYNMPSKCFRCKYHPICDTECYFNDVDKLGDKICEGTKEWVKKEYEKQIAEHKLI